MEPALSLVIPLHREAEHLRSSLAVIRQAMDRLPEPYEVILVDDGSPDATWQAVCDSAGADARLRGIRLTRRFGKEAAICAGLEAARGQAVIVMDGDLQHPPDLIPLMVQTWRETGANVVEGVKSPASRERLGAKVRRGLYARLMRRLSGFELDGASDFKLIDVAVRQAWLKMGERALFFRGMIAWLGFRTVQVPFEVARRAGGRSSWSRRDLLHLAMTGLTAFSAIPVRLAGLLGLLFLVFAVVLGGYALAMWFAGRALTGFTTVILLQLFVGSLVLLSLGVMGEYIARIYEEVKGRPRYVVSGYTDPSQAPGPDRAQGAGDKVDKEPSEQLGRQSDTGRPTGEEVAP